MVPSPGAVPIRLPVLKAITTVGSERTADVVVSTVPPRWAVVRREDQRLSVRLLHTGEAHWLAPGESLVLDGITLLVERHDEGPALPLERLTSALAAADSAAGAFEALLDGVLEATGADTGAILSLEDGAYAVASARDRHGKLTEAAVELLSDTIIKDALSGGRQICLTDVAGHGRYAHVPSVVNLQLRSVLCLPLSLDGRTLGALYLGKRSARASFGPRLVEGLKVLAAMAVPYLVQLKRASATTPSSELILGDSAAMQRVKNLIARVGPSELGVLVLGPSGTGKELVARAIHAASPRHRRPLIAVNCAAIPASLLDAELFGYKKGAFTGAQADRKGLIEAAHESTLFLDEVGDMPLPMQAALLRVLEQREVRRLGETRARTVDFRLVAATNRDLAADVKAGRFREDLYFRLREVAIDVPPLRQREGDILLLARTFLRQVESQLGLKPQRLSPEAEAALCGHTWPGNVRELKAAVRRAALLCGDDPIAPEHLELDGAPVHAASAAAPGLADLGDISRPLPEARDDFVRRYVLAALERHNGDRQATARALGIGLRTLYRHIA